MSGKLGWPWSVLNLDPKGADKRGVKRAYAKLLKAIDPQEDAQGFQDLRTAYEQALRMAPQNAQTAPAATPPAPPPPAAEDIENLPPAPSAPTATPPLTPVRKRPLPPPPPAFAPAAQIRSDPKALGVLVTESQALFSREDLRPEAWRPIFNRLTELDFVEARRFEKELLKAFDTHLFPDGVRPSYVMKRPWLELLDTRFGWFSHGLDFQRKHPEHFKLWSYLNDIYRPPLTVRQVQKAAHKADLARDPKVPFYLRWWFLLFGYLGLTFWVV